MNAPTDKKTQKPARGESHPNFTMDDIARRFLSAPPAPDRPSKPQKKARRKAPSTRRKSPRRS